MLRMKVFESVVPVAMVPKAIVAGVTARAAGATPVPLKATTAFPAALLMVMVPVDAVCTVGENFAVTVTDAPAARLEFDAGRPVVENGAAGPLLVLKVSETPPVLVMVNACVGVAPIATAPKAMLALLTER